MVVDDLAAEGGGQVALGNGHADRIGESLAERSGGRLHSGGQKVLGMARRDRAELAEAPQLLDRHRLVAEQMKQRIDQHRAMSGRQHEAVAIGPAGIRGIEFEKAREQHGGNVGGAHGQTGVPGFRLLDRIHRERTDGVRHPIVLRSRDPLHPGADGRRRGGRFGCGQGRTWIAHGWPRRDISSEPLARGRGESNHRRDHRPRHAQDPGQGDHSVDGKPSENLKFRF